MARARALALALLLALLLAPSDDDAFGGASTTLARGAVVASQCPVGDDAILRTTGSDGAVASGDLSHPASLVSGCSYDFHLGDRTELYLVVKRDSVDQRLTIEWDLTYEYKAPTFAFTWNGQSTRGAAGLNPHTHPDIKSVMYADWLWTPGAPTGSHTFVQRDDGKDEYHCSPACQKYETDLPSKTGDLYITLSTWQAYNPVEGSVIVRMETPRRAIKGAQLDAIKEVYDATCASRLAPADWSSDEYLANENTDPGQMPHCDWIPGGWKSTWHTSNACDEIPGLTCDGDGDVLALRVTEKGLAGDLPPGLAGKLPKLEDVNLDGNALTGNVLEVLMYSSSIRSFSAAGNGLTGRIPCPGAGPPPPKESTSSESDWSDWEATAATACGANEGNPYVRHKGARGLYHLDLGQNALDGTVPGACLVACAPSLASVDLAGNRLVGAIPAAFANLSDTLVALNLGQNRLTGTLPASYASLARLRTLDLSVNRIGGAIPPSWMTDMHALYTVDLSHNELAGELPATGPSMTRLRRVFLDHNKLRGSFGAQLTRMYDALKSETHERDSFAAGTTYALSGNSFSGALPEALRSLFKHPKTARSLAQVRLGGNRFRCDKDTGGWPQWAARLQLGHEHSFGRCQPVPAISSVRTLDERAKASSESSGDDGAGDRPIVVVRMGDPLEIRGEGFVVSDEARCRFAIRDGRDDDGTERWRIAYSPATILAESNSTNRDPGPSQTVTNPGGSRGVLTCDAGVFDASDLDVPVDAVVSVAMFGDDFYDADTVSNHRPSLVRLACPERVAGAHCQHTASNLCHDAGVPTDDGACTCDEGRVGARCDACAQGWSATYVVDGGEMWAGEFGADAGRLTSCDPPDVTDSGGGTGAPTLVPWAEWALIAGSCVTTALATVLYVMVTRELRGTPVFSPAARTISPTAAEAPNLRDSSGDWSRNASRNPPDGEIPFDDAFGGSLPPMVGRGYANLRDEESGR